MERTEFVSSGRRVGGLAEIGDIVGYEDVANVWRAAEVVGLARHHITEVPYDYTLRYLDDQSKHFSDLRQYGWTFGKVYVPEGKRLPITSAESQSYIDDGDLPDADDGLPVCEACGVKVTDDMTAEFAPFCSAECQAKGPDVLALVDEYIPCAGGCGRPVPTIGGFCAVCEAPASEEVDALTRWTFPDQQHSL